MTVKYERMRVGASHLEESFYSNELKEDKGKIYNKNARNDNVTKGTLARGILYLFSNYFYSFISTRTKLHTYMHLQYLFGLKGCIKILHIHLIDTREGEN